MNKSYYAVAVGRVPGVYKSWSECQQQIYGIRSVFKKFPTLDEAEKFVENSSTKRKLTEEGEERSTNRVQSITNNNKPSSGDNVLYCDGGSNRQTRSNGQNEAWGSVVFGDGSDALSDISIHELLQPLIMRQEQLPIGLRTIIVAVAKDVKTQNNNFAELLAMYAACQIALYHPSGNKIDTIYSDSSLIIDYWSKGSISKTTCVKMDPMKLMYIEKLVESRFLFEKKKSGKVVKISGSENNADLGYH